jgi:isochorismate hydrolase
MLEFAGRKVLNELRETVEPGRAVLLVWDMQKRTGEGFF